MLVACPTCSATSTVFKSQIGTTRVCGNCALEFRVDKGLVIDEVRRPSPPEAKPIAPPSDLERLWKDNGEAIAWGALALFGVVMLSLPVLMGSGNASPRSRTEHERNEESMRGYFKSKYPTVSDDAINESAKRIADEWENARPDGRDH